MDKKFYSSCYDNMDLYVKSFNTGAEAYYHDKKDNKWYLCKVDYIGNELPSPNSDVDGEFITDDTSVCVGLHIVEQLRV